MKKKFLTFYKIMLTFGSCLLAVLFKSNINWTDWSKNYFDVFLAKEIAYDLAMGIFSAMVLVWFIDTISDYLNERDAIRKETEAIFRFNTVLQHYISNYFRAYYDVIVPVNERDNTTRVHTKSFALRDMRDLYKSTMQNDYSPCDSAVQLFFEREAELTNQITFLLMNIDIKKYVELQLIFISFLDKSLSFTGRATILDAPNRMIGKHRKDITVSKLLKSGKGDRYRIDLIKKKTSKSNILYPYVALYELMQEERKILLNYNETIAKIINKKRNNG